MMEHEIRVNSSKYRISISKVNNGAIIQVGCKTIVVKNDEIPAAMADIGRLLIGNCRVQEELRSKYMPEECMSDGAEAAGLVRREPVFDDPNGAVAAPR